MLTVSISLCSLCCTWKAVLLKYESGGYLRVLKVLVSGGVSDVGLDTRSLVAVGGIMRIGRKNLNLETSWQQYSNCLGVDPDLFFPERGASTREAKEVCRACMVQHDCLEFALMNSEKFGIWGGMSERERRRIRRARALELQRTVVIAETTVDITSGAESVDAESTERVGVGGNMS